MAGTESKVNAEIETAAIVSDRDDRLSNASNASTYGGTRETRYEHDIYISDNNENIVYRDPNGKKILFYEMKIKRISDIDTTKESFRCWFHIYLTWLATKEECDLFEASKNNNTKYTPQWVPTLTWANAIQYFRETTENDRNYTIKSAKSRGLSEEAWRLDSNYFKFEPWLGRWNRVKIEYEAEFAEELELPAFPFDCQDLTLFLKVDDDNVYECDIVPFPRWTDFCMLDPKFSVLSEWDFESLLCEFGSTDAIASRSKKEYPLVAIHIKVARRWQVFDGQILVAFCMFTLGLGAFVQGLHAEELGDRLGYCVTLLLADVASLQLLFDYLPNVPYWTIFHYYVYYTFGFLFAVTAWSSFAGFMNNQILDGTEDAFRTFDNFAFAVFAIVWFLLNITFIIRSIRTRKHEKSKLNMTSKEIESNFNTQRSKRDRKAIFVPWSQKDFLNDNMHHHLMNARDICVRGTIVQSDDILEAFKPDRPVGKYKQA